MRQVLFLLLAAALAVVITGSSFRVAVGAPEQKTAVKYVNMKDDPVTEGVFAYTPAKLTVKVGTKVVWRNESSQPHTVTSTHTPPRFDSGINTLINPGETWSHVFKRAGVYHYVCTIHPDMKGTVVVKA